MTDTCNSEKISKILLKILLFYSYVFGITVTKYNAQTNRVEKSTLLQLFCLLKIVFVCTAYTVLFVVYRDGKVLTFEVNLVVGMVFWLDVYNKLLGFVVIWFNSSRNAQNFIDVFDQMSKLYACMTKDQYLIMDSKFAALIGVKLLVFVAKSITYISVILIIDPNYDWHFLATWMFLMFLSNALEIATNQFHCAVLLIWKFYEVLCHDVVKIMSEIKELTAQRLEVGREKRRIEEILTFSRHIEFKQCEARVRAITATERTVRQKECHCVRRLRRLSLLYHQIQTLINSVNEMYKLQNVVYLVSALLNLISTLFYEYGVLFKTDDHNVFLLFSLMALIFCDINLFLKVMEMAICNGKYIDKLLLYKTNIYGLRKSIADAISTFKINMLQNDVKFEIFGFLRLNMRTAFVLQSAAISQFIVLVQFDLANKPVN